MAGSIINAEWLNQNSLRKYPLSEEALVRDTTDSFGLPDDFLVDAIIPVHATMNLDVSTFQVLRVSIFGTGIVLELGHNGVLLGTATIPVTGFVENSTYFVQGVGDFSDILGKVTIGRLDGVLNSAGVFSFDLANGRIEASVIVPDIRGVDAVQILSGNELGDLLQGDIAFEAGINIRMGLSTFGGVSVITVDAIDGEGTIADCDCDGDLASGPGIKTLNGVGPDSEGNVELRGDDCLEPLPVPEENAIDMDDKCSKPCCGCPELEVLAGDQGRMRDQVQTLENLAAQLEGVIAALQTVVAAS